jgi:pimeloyl-ACP methyl ester carboxylesterase
MGAMLERQVVSADGFELGVLVGGLGRPLLVLHGGGGLHPGEAHRLLAERFRVYAVELPGFGASPENTTTRSLEELGGTILAAADALGLERFSLLGTSFGGAVALRVALRAPERVERLVLESPAVFRGAGWRPPADLQRALHLHPEKRSQAGPPDPAVVAKQVALVSRLLGAADDEALREPLRTLGVPTLVVHGESDGMHDPRGSRELVAALPDARFELAPDAAHEVGSDQPEAYARVVSRFLEG